MGRMTKQGIEYFSLDVQFDDKTELYLLETEAIGLAVMITLWQLIYQNEGYYIINSNDLCLLVKRRINVNINDINACINKMLARGIFNKCLYEKYSILTSKAIQKRYFDAAKRKKQVKVINEFVLIDLDLCENIIYVNINDINVYKNDINVCKNATKEKEKEKEKETDFEVFWKAYPNKTEKKYTLKCWKKLKSTRPPIEELLKAIKKQIEWREKANGEFRPEWKNPATWLNKGCWDDELTEEKKSTW
jgi:hypothetical protein